MSSNVNTAGTVLSSRRRHNKVKLVEAGWGWLFIAPVAIGLIVFYIFPVFQTAYFSFSKWGAFGGHTFNGLDNYKTLIHDGNVLRALLNTLLYMAIQVVGIPIAIYLASLINRESLRGKSIYRTLYFLPVVTMPAAISIVWRLIYAGDYGIINYLLSLVGIKGPYWLQDSRTALVAVAIVGVWSSLGYNMILFSAGLQGIPKTLYEAAELDGATPWQQFRRITVPLLSPTVFFVAILTVINGLQVFDLIFVMIGGRNPIMQDVESLVYMFYNQAFTRNNMGYASVIAVLILAVTGVFTWLQFRMQRKWVNYV